jgi:hypothetical protein
MVAVVLLTTVLTPIALRAAFHVKTQEEIEQELREAIRAARESELHMSMTLRLAEKEAVSE